MHRKNFLILTLLIYALFLYACTTSSEMNQLGSSMNNPIPLTKETQNYEAVQLSKSDITGKWELHNLRVNSSIGTVEHFEEKLNLSPSDRIMIFDSVELKKIFIKDYPEYSTGINALFYSNKTNFIKYVPLGGLTEINYALILEDESILLSSNNILKLENKYYECEITEIYKKIK